MIMNTTKRRRISIQRRPSRRRAVVPFNRFGRHNDVSPDTRAFVSLAPVESVHTFVNKLALPKHQSNNFGRSSTAQVVKREPGLHVLGTGVKHGVNLVEGKRVVLSRADAYFLDVHANSPDDPQFVCPVVHDHDSRQIVINGARSQPALNANFFECRQVLAGDAICLNVPPQQTKALEIELVVIREFRASFDEFGLNESIGQFINGRHARRLFNLVQINFCLPPLPPSFQFI